MAHSLKSISIVNSICFAFNNKYKTKKIICYLLLALSKKGNFGFKHRKIITTQKRQDFKKVSKMIDL